MKETKGNGIIKLIAIGAIAALAYAQFGPIGLIAVGAVLMAMAG